MGVIRRGSRSEYNNGHPHSVISYIGGKSQLISNIVPLIIYAANTYNLSSYYELCGGGARMLLNLPTALFQHRSYNDMDRGLCSLFACLGDKRYLYDLMAMLEDLGVGEDVFLRAKHAREYEAQMQSQGSDFGLGIVTSAAYAFILAMQSRAADMESFDFSRVKDQKRLRSYFKRVRELDLFYPTLEDIEVTHGDCRELLKLLNGKDGVFAYLDPPYTPEQMVLKDHYGARSWTLDEHDRLVDLLLKTSGVMMALSGYDNPCYDRLVSAGWRKLYLKNVFVASSSEARRRNDEYLWINFDVPDSLLDQISEFDYTAW